MEQYGKEAESKAKEAKAELEKQANKTGRDLQGAVDKFDKNVEEVSFVLLFFVFGGLIGVGGCGWLSGMGLGTVDGGIGCADARSCGFVFDLCCLLTFVILSRAPARPRAPSRVGLEGSKLFAMRGSTSEAKDRYT